MAVETQAPPQDQEADIIESIADTEPDLAQQPSRRGRYSSIIQRLSGHGLMVTLAISLFANGIALARLNSAGGSGRKQLTPEVALGEFEFNSVHAAAGQVIKAQFAVHVALSEDVEKEGRRRMSEREFRLRQDVEELFRGAHSGDFDDPLLRNLKERLKERVNKTLGIRAAAYVIITGLETERKVSPSVEEEAPASLVPWVESSTE